MSDDVELEAAYWLDLVNKTCNELEVQDVLERHGISLGNVRWKEGIGLVTLSRCGIRLLLKKAGSADAACVIGVEFAVAGLDDGGSYDGSLPHGIDGAATLMDITLKLHPAMPTQAAEPGSFDAVFPEYRLVIRMNEDDMLQALTWMTTRDPGAI
jgi:hypothetical protein